MSGFDWKPGCTKSFEGKGDAAQPIPNPVSNQNASDLHKRIQDQGNKVRQLKSSKAAKVRYLLLKFEYK